MVNKIWKYGDDINTDYIFPGVYTYTLMTESEMGTHAMEGIDINFTTSAAKGDIIVAGKNWGCGSSREQAVKCLKARGITAIIAKSFARIFYRNALNEGLHAIICPNAVENINADDDIFIDFDRGIIMNGQSIFPFQQYPEFVTELVKYGGLIPYVKENLKKRGKL